VAQPQKWNKKGARAARVGEARFEWEAEATIPTKMNRRTALKSLTVGGAAVTFGTQLAFAQAEPQVDIGELKKLAKDWDSLPFRYDDDAALLVRVPAAGKPERALEVSIDSKKSYLVAYMQVCPHTGCLPDLKPNHQLECPCHGSVFNANDGGLKKGPARRGLDGIKLEVRGANVFAVGKIK
jgi:Rieske Fe-S protein